MTRDWMAIERAREAGEQPDYDDEKDSCKCSRCESRLQRSDKITSVSALEARVAELEKRLAAGFPQGVTTTSVSNGNGTACTRCGVVGFQTGAFYAPVTPLREVRCPVCGAKWGVL